MNAKIMTFGDTSKFANTTDPEIPAAFAGLVGDITGLQNLGTQEAMLKPSRIHGLPVAKPSKTSQPAAKLKSGLLPLFNFLDHGFACDATCNTFAPADFYTFYDETPLLNEGINGAASNDCIAIFAASNIFMNVVNTFTSDPKQLGYSLTPVNLTVDTSAEGDPGVIAGFDGEAFLDIEWSHAVAPGDPIILYVANDNPASGFTIPQNY